MKDFVSRLCHHVANHLVFEKSLVAHKRLLVVLLPQSPPIWSDLALQFGLPLSNLVFPCPSDCLLVDLEKP